MRMFGKIKIVILAGLIGVVSLLSGCSASAKQYNSTDTAMGTIISQCIYAADEQIAEAAFKTLIEELERLEMHVLSWREKTSQVYEINASAAMENGSTLTEELSSILAQIWEVSEASEGALDITIGEVVRLWKIDEYAAGNSEGEFGRPDPVALENALQRTGFSQVELKEERIYMPGGMSLDLGAVGKGIACDKLRDKLKAMDIKGAIISVGGSILTYGNKPDGSAWKVGIVNPHDTSSYIGTLTLTGDWCVSTSGDYERYVEADGIRYHHIIDPKTGYPANAGLSSVTVLSRDGALSDALSTACFVLGVEKAQDLLEQYDAYAVMVEHSGKVILSEGAEQFFHNN